jgi:hypothetical protein
MKISRIIPIFLVAGVAIFAGATIWQGLSKGGRGFGRGATYGNLWVDYNWQERGIREDKVNWLIATPGKIMKQGYSGAEGECYITFKDGKTFRFSPDSEKLIWVDTIKGPEAFPVGSSRKFIEDIERSRDKAKQQTFQSAEEFIEQVKTGRTEHVVGGNGG